MPSINAHQQLLDRRLGESGWVVDERRESDLWWIGGIWLIRSSWHPQGFQLFLIFLVDPQSPSGAPPDSAVWAVAASSIVPREQGTQWPALLPLGRRWERNIDEFFAALSDLRDREAVPQEAG